MLKNFPENKLLEERAILVGCLGRYDRAIHIYINVFKNPDAAEAYCDDLYEREQCRGPHPVYMALLKEHLKRFFPKQPLEKSAADKRVLELSKLLHRHHGRIDPVQALMVRPSPSDRPSVQSSPVHCSHSHRGAKEGGGGSVLCGWPCTCCVLAARCGSGRCVGSSQVLLAVWNVALAPTSVPRSAITTTTTTTNNNKINHHHTNNNNDDDDDDDDDDNNNNNNNNNNNHQNNNHQNKTTTTTPTTTTGAAAKHFRQAAAVLPGRSLPRRQPQPPQCIRD